MCTIRRNFNIKVVFIKINLFNFKFITVWVAIIEENVHDCWFEYLNEKSIIHSIGDIRVFKHIYMNPGPLRYTWPLNFFYPVFHRVRTKIVLRNVIKDAVVCPVCPSIAMLRKSDIAHFKRIIFRVVIVKKNIHTNNFLRQGFHAVSHGYGRLVLGP